MVLEGLPAGLEITVEEIQAEMARRRLGYGRGPRQRFEVDELTLIGGVRHGRTLGSPLAIEIKNTEWFRSDKWHEEMSPAPGETKDHHAGPTRPRRPGRHAEVPTIPCSNGPRRARRRPASPAAPSPRSCCRTRRRDHLARHPDGTGQSALTRRDPRRPISSSSTPTMVRCFDEAAGAAMVDETGAAAKEGDSLGGVAEVLGFNVPVGPVRIVHWDRKLDGMLAQALMSIQAVMGVEIGDGSKRYRLGSAAHDPIRWDSDQQRWLTRLSTLAGGLEGGITNGELAVARAAMKPLATLNRPTLETVDVVVKETVSFKERTDVTAVPAMGVVAETMVALVLAQEAQRKFGGDSIGEFVRNAESFRDNMEP
ncbi:MAG: chorismate synthase [Ilumatobacteraceae bacterium]